MGSFAQAVTDRLRKGVKPTPWFTPTEKKEGDLVFTNIGRKDNE